MFDFGTSSGQVLYPSRTKNGISNGQALVPYIKHIQTIENTKNDNKPENFENSSFKDFENKEKQNTAVPYRDNLKTTKEKDYNEPL